jgi:hypothetical protein
VVSERHIVWELIVHGIAFCIAAAIGAAILSRYYAILEHDTDSASAAREAFVTCVVIAGGVGPAITLTAFWLARAIRRHRQ